MKQKPRVELGKNDTRWCVALSAPVHFWKPLNSSRIFPHKIGYHTKFIMSWRLSGIVVNGLALSLRISGSYPGHATILLGSILGQVVYSHCLPSLLSSKKLGFQTGLL